MEELLGVFDEQVSRETRMSIALSHCIQAMNIAAPCLEREWPGMAVMLRDVARDADNARGRS